MEGILTRDNLESPVVTLTTGNAYRAIFKDANEMSANIYLKPNGAAGWYPVQSWPHTSMNDVPAALALGDEIKIVAKATGQDDDAELAYFIEEISI